MAITQGELAEEFKVSQMTISRALRGSEGVSKKLRQAILQKAQERGYSPEESFEARSLRRRAFGARSATKVICVIVWDVALAGGTGAPFNQRILRGVVASAQAAGTEVIVAPHMQAQLPRVVLRRQVDGVVWLLTDTHVRHGATVCPVPWVSLLFDVPGADVVGVDNALAAHALGQHLANLGHRQVAFIGPASPLARERLAGVRAGLATRGGAVPDALVSCAPLAMGPASTERLMAQLWEQSGARPGACPWTAVAVYNDFMAATVMRWLQARGLRVPQDVSVTGFDGTLPSDQPAAVPLTTAVIPLEELGAEAVRLLDWRLQQPTAPRRRVLLEAAFAVGGSTAAALVAAP